PAGAIARRPAVIDEITVVEKRYVKRALMSQLAGRPQPRGFVGVGGIVDLAVESGLAVERLDEVLATQAWREGLAATAPDRLHPVVELLHRQQVEVAEHVAEQRTEREPVIGR